MNSNEKREADLYNDICHLLLILQTLRTLPVDHEAYPSIEEKKEQALHALLCNLCDMRGVKSQIYPLLNELIKSTESNSIAHNLAKQIRGIIDTFTRN